MKRLVLILFLLPFVSKAQFPGTDSLRNYNNKYITNNPATAFTNLRLNTLLRGIIDWVDTARAGTGGGGALGIDTLWAVNDSTIRYRKGGVFRTFIMKGVYESRRKVDTAYAVNDTTLRITINGLVRNIILPGRGSSSSNLATGNQTATGDRTHDWANKGLYFNNLKAFELHSDRPDGVLTSNRKVVDFYLDSTTGGNPFRVEWRLKTVDELNDSIASIIGTNSTGTFIYHHGYNGNAYSYIENNGNLLSPFINMQVVEGVKASSMQINKVVKILPSDSLRVKLHAAATADTIMGLRHKVGNEYTVVAIPTPAGSSGSATLSNQGSGFRLVKTANGQIKTVFGGYGVTIDSSSNTDALTFKADTSSTNHLITQSDLNDSAAAIRASIGSGGSGEANTASNVGSGTGLFKTKSGVDLQFKSLTAPYGVVITSNTNDVALSADTSTLKSVYIPLTLNASKTINLAGNNLRIAGGGQFINDSVRYEQTYMNPTKGLDSALYGGNSIAFMQNATSRDSAYAGRSAASWGIPYTNIGVPSTVMYQICAASLAYLNPGHNAIQVVEGGLNDKRNYGSGVNVDRGIGNGMEAMIINHVMGSYTAASSCTLFGSWTTPYDAKANAGGKTTGAAYSSTLNDSITKDVTGTNVYIGLIGQYSGARSADIYVDGVLHRNVITDNQTFAAGTGYQSMGVYITGLTNTSHHVKIVVGSGSGFLLVDYIGVGGSTMKPIVVVQIPHMDATGYSGSNATQSNIDVANDTLAARVSRAQAAGLNVKLARTNDYYVATTSDGLDADHIHPNNRGHFQIAQAILNSLDPARSPVGTVKYSNDGRLYVTDLSGAMKRIPYESDITFQKVLTAGSGLVGANTVTGSKFNWSGFTDYRINNFIVNNASSAIMRGVLAVQGSSGTIAALNRSGDTTKGFVWYTDGNISRFYETFNNVEFIKMDTSMRTLVRNNSANNVLLNPTATWHIVGNNGRPAHATLKLDSSTLMATPEPYAIEATADSLYWTNGAGVRVGLNRIGSGGLTGTGTSGRVAIWNGSSSLTSDAGLIYSSGQLGVGTTPVTGARLTIGGGVSPLAINAGHQSYWSAATYLDNTTAASGTVTTLSANYIGQPTYSATNTGVTIGNASTLRIDKPLSGTNVTVQRPYSLTTFGTLNMGGGVREKVDSINTNTTLTGDENMLLIDANSGNVTITLPSASIAYDPAWKTGSKFSFVRLDGSGNTVTIQRAGSDTISGATSFTLTQWQVKDVICGGTTLWLIR